MFRLAWRNLLHDRGRLAISTGGVALAVLLILVMGGVFAGSEVHAVAYMRNQPAELWLMQAGVENMHMSSSLLPTDTVARARRVEGVAQAVGLLYSGAGVDVGETVVSSYLFAVDRDAPFGGPWKLAEGTAAVGPSEVVIDRALAARYGLALGDRVRILGYDLTIAGLSEESFGIATSLTWINKQALALTMGISPEAASYVLIQLEPDVKLEDVAAALRAAIPEANLLTREAFIASDQQMIRQMGTDIIRIMTGVAYLVGLLVIGLTIYVATLERAREYGMLKAIGAHTTDLAQVVVVQAFVSSTLGLALGAALAYGVAALIGRLLPEMLVLIEPETLLGQVPVLAGVTLLAALLPLARIARLDPMVVFQS